MRVLIVDSIWNIAMGWKTRHDDARAHARNLNLFRRCWQRVGGSETEEGWTIKTLRYPMKQRYFRVSIASHKFHCRYPFPCSTTLHIRAVEQWAKSIHKQHQRDVNEAWKRKLYDCCMNKRFMDLIRYLFGLCYEIYKKVREKKHPMWMRITLVLFRLVVCTLVVGMRHSVCPLNL